MRMLYWKVRKECNCQKNLQSRKIFNNVPSVYKGYIVVNANLLKNHNITDVLQLTFLRAQSNFKMCYKGVGQIKA